MLRTIVAAGGLVVGVVLPAAAYAGAGAGLSLLGAFWGLGLATLTVLGAALLWPLRQLFGRRRVGRSSPPR